MLIMIDINAWLLYKRSEGKKMKYYEKIKKIRKDLNLTVRDVYERGLVILGPQKCISIPTINRIEAGHTHKFSSLNTLCYLLNIPLKELFKDTEFEECLIIRKREREKSGGYIFGPTASSSIINNPNHSFLAQEFVLQPAGQTPIDRAPQGRGKYEKLVYVVMGQLVCVIADKEMTLKGGDSVSFDSTKSHQFKNISKVKCKFIAIENPGRY